MLCRCDTEHTSSNTGCYVTGPMTTKERRERTKWLFWSKSQARLRSQSFERWSHASLICSDLLTTPVRVVDYPLFALRLLFTPDSFLARRPSLSVNNQICPRLISPSHPSLAAHHTSRSALSSTCPPSTHSQYHNHLFTSHP